MDLSLSLTNLACPSKNSSNSLFESFLVFFVYADIFFNSLEI
jgi:hypothetical protein